MIEDEGKRLRLIAGSLYGERAPVEVFSDMVYADAMLSGTVRLDLPGEYEERAVWVAEGRIEAGGDIFAGCSFFGPARRSRSRLWTSAD